MLWYLSSEGNTRVIYVLPGKDITIGRSLDAEMCNFAIPDDSSISRKHVTLSVAENNLYLEDLGSKYGTFINDSNAPIEHNKKIKLECDNKITLGKMGSVWKVNKINMVTCSSTLKGESLQYLRNNLSKLCAVLKADWDDTCSYLTMPAITLTIKVVLALVQNSYIVNTDYWSKCIESINNNTPLPDPSKYVPQILEPTLNKEDVSFLPSKERCSLFAGKRIIFFSRRQLEMYKTVLMKSSATALLLSETKLTKKSLLDSDVVVIQFNITQNNPDTQAQKDQIKEITDYLKSQGKRIVADAEIGLAILYCSTSKYCNPYFNFSTEVIKQTSQENKTGKEILAQETQEPSQVTVKKENIQINESLTVNDISSGSMKRKFSGDEVSESNKRVATNVISSTMNDSKKRPAEMDIQKPTKKMALDNEDDEGMFNFVPSESGSKSNESNKKLNFLKPQKRKLDSVENDDGDLFNFVEDSNSSESEISKKTKISDENKIVDIAKNIEEKVDISALRGKKLQELIEYNSNMAYYKEIKKEDTSELDEKFSNIDLGSTVVIVNKDLIIKKEPTTILESSSENGVKNFKKFKKVWPVKMQISVVTDKSNTETNNLAMDAVNTVSVNG